MISRKIWGDFKKHRQGLIDEWEGSDKYREIEKYRDSIFEEKEGKFLGFSFKGHASPAQVSLALSWVAQQTEMHTPHIPEETVEECLNWLTGSGSGQ